MNFNKVLFLAFYLLTACLALPLLQAQELATNFDPTVGPWIERSDGHFRFVYKKADAAVALKYVAISNEVYGIVTGYMQLEPKEKPVVILYGSMDDPPVGGFTASGPMRMGLEVENGQIFSPKTLLLHEFTHYMQMSLKKSGYIGRLIEPLFPEARQNYSATLSDLSLEGSTSFIDGYRRSEYASLPIRAAVLEGQMWDYDQIATGGLRQPMGYRTYLSQMLVQDWLFDHCPDDALLRILDLRDKHFHALESKAFREYTGIDVKTAWGDIRTELEKRFAFARSLPQGQSVTPRDSEAEPQWSFLRPSAHGYLQSRGDLNNPKTLGFWQPLSREKAKPNKSKPEILKRDIGLFVPLEGLVASDFAVDASAAKVAAIVTDPADTTLLHDRNRSRLVLAAVAWNSDYSKARAIDIKSFPDSGFSSPCLSPDGSRLFATIRFSDMYRAAEIDMASGGARALSIPADLSVNEMAVSPDGRRLALALVSNGVYDVGIYDLVAEEFTFVTRDSAMDMAPVFLSDGSLAFSSDRENSISVYRHSNGAFNREIVDSIAALYPVEDGKGGYYYSSYSAYGRVIRHMDAETLQKSDFPEFGQTVPSWLARRDLIWATYSNKGIELSKRDDAEKKTTGDDTVAKEKLFLDIALPRVWFPVIGYDRAGWSFGAAALMATSYLGETVYSATFQYYPDAKQMAASLDLSLFFPSMSLDLALGQTYYGSLGDNSVLSYFLKRYAAVGAELPLYTRRNPDRSVTRLSAAVDLSYSENISSDSQISLSSEWSLAPSRSFIALPGVKGRIEWPYPDTALSGGSFLSADARVLLEASSAQAGPGFGGLFALGAGLRLGSSLVSFSGKGAYRGNGSAQELVPRAVERWESDSTAPWHLEAGISWAFSSLLEEQSNFYLLREQEGMALSAKTFWEASETLSPRVIPELEVSLEYLTKLVIYYTAQPISFGIGYRFPIPNSTSLLGFEPENLCFRVSVMTQSLVW